MRSFLHTKGSNKLRGGGVILLLKHFCKITWTIMHIIGNQVQVHISIIILHKVIFQRGSNSFRSLIR